MYHIRQTAHRKKMEGTPHGPTIFLEEVGGHIVGEVVIGIFYVNDVANSEVHQQQQLRRRLQRIHGRAR